MLQQFVDKPWDAAESKADHRVSPHGNRRTKELIGTTNLTSLRQIMATSKLSANPQLMALAQILGPSPSSTRSSHQEMLKTFEVPHIDQMKASNSPKRKQANGIQKQLMDAANSAQQEMEKMEPRSSRRPRGQC